MMGQKKEERSDSSLKQCLTSKNFSFEIDALQQALSYKRKMIAGDMCTVILDSEAAKKQCDSLARGLYSLVFTYLVEAMNRQMCRRQEDQVSFIGILDMPGFDAHSPTGFENFCTNFCNEALQGFLQQKTFVEDPQAMSGDGLLVTEPKLDERSQANIDLLCGMDTLTDASPRGLVKFLHEATLKAGKESGDTESSSMLPGMNRAFQSNSSYISGSAYASSFGIRHYGGDVQYNLASFFVRNQDILSPDFISLFQTSHSPFMLQMLESNPSLVMESHPRSKETIVKAQLSTMPLRQPSVRKSKQTQVQARRKGRSNNAVSTVIKQLHSTLRDICTSLDGTQLYQVVHIRPNNRMSEGLIECDPVFVRSQIESFRLSALVQSKVRADYCVSFDHASFLQRYKVLFERRGLSYDKAAPDSDQCRTLAGLLNWQMPKDGSIGRSYVWISFSVWSTLEDECISIEKTEGGSVGFEADPEEQRQFSSFVTPPVNESLAYKAPMTGDDSNVSTQLLTAYRPRAQSDASDKSDASQASHAYPTTTESGFVGYNPGYNPGYQAYARDSDSPVSDNKTIDTPGMDNER